MNIKVDIVDKHATTLGAPVIICGNSDYSITFTFDDEWAEHDTKTARFAYVRAGVLQYTDVIFTGDTVDVPVLAEITEVRVGVFAGDLRTSTPARIPCEYSIRCGTGAPVEPTPDVYDQIMALLNTGGGGGNAGGGGGSPEPTIQVILPETEMIEDAEAYVVLADVTFNDGTIYTVTIGGAEYMSKGVYVAEIGGVAVGNLGLVGIGPDTGEPFLLFPIPQDPPILVIAGYSGGAGTIKIESIDYGQSDWNQNDSTASDFIVNRPFYTALVTLLPEKDLTFTGGQYADEEWTGFNFTLGQNYTVTWNGTAYQCTARAVGDGAAGVGNIGFIDGTGIDTGEPFIMAASLESMLFLVMSINNEPSATVSVTGEQVIPLPEKYLPSTVAKKSDVEELILGAIGGEY